MLTSQIESYCDIGGISAPDINLKVLLRHNTIPAFLADVGYVSWRRTPATITTVIGTQAYDLPDDFWMLQSLTIDPNSSKQLAYIGDDPEKVMAAEANVVNATTDLISGWYLTRRTTTLVFKKIKFSAPFAAVATVRYVYYSTVPFADDTTDVEMDKYVPNQFQWALVEGLKKEIMFLRFGIGDPRYVAAEQSYQGWLGRIAENPELAQRNKVSFAR